MAKPKTMRISIEIPSWAAEEKRDIYILAGIEEIAHKPHGKRWRVKTNRCNMCGKCCMDVPDNWVHGKVGNNCQHLTHIANEYRCGLLGNRPFGCCIGDNAEEPYCSVKWKTK